MIIAIWAQDVNGLIGLDNRLPWHLPADLQFFKQQTLRHTIVMGRKTFEGMGGRPLPNRQTIVLTRDTSYQNNQVMVMNTIDQVIAYAANHDQPVFITGGALIYRDFLPYCQQLYRTVIEAEFEGDTYFPPVDWQQWQLVKTDKGTVDEKNHYAHRFEFYQRVKEEK